MLSSTAGGRWQALRLWTLAKKAQADPSRAKARSAQMPSRKENSILSPYCPVTVLPCHRVAWHRLAKAK